MKSLTMRLVLLGLTLVTLVSCSKQGLLQKFSSPEDQATARSYIDRLRTGNFEDLEQALDPAIRTPNARDTLVKMAALLPDQEPVSVKVVGARVVSTPDAKTVNTTFEYDFGDKWLLANVAVRDRQGTKTIVDFNVNAMEQSLEVQNRFTLAGKSAIQYGVLVAAVTAVLVTLCALIVCVRTRLSRRKWLWVLFILAGFGQVAVNWTTGQWAVALVSVQLFSASAVAPLYGPWTISVSLPIGAIVFLAHKRSRLEQRTAN